MSNRESPRSGSNREWPYANEEHLQELIKVRGFQVAPPELEAVLLAHPDIVDCAIIGVRLKGVHQDESPRAYVVRRPGTHITEQEVKDVISKQLASYKALTGGVVFIDEVPKSASGKILVSGLSGSFDIMLCSSFEVLSASESDTDDVSRNGY